MSHHTFGGRQVVRPLTGLDFGLHVHVDLRPLQRSIFPGAPNFTVRALTEELAETVSSLRVYSYVVRGQLQHVTSALLANVECGDWRYARRAALDLAGILTLAQRRRVVAGDLGIRGSLTISWRAETSWLYSMRLPKASVWLLMRPSS
jgi:hypothetical protein